VLYCFCYISAKPLNKMILARSWYAVLPKKLKFTTCCFHSTRYIIFSNILFRYKIICQRPHKNTKILQPIMTSFLQHSTDRVTWNEQHSLFISEGLPSYNVGPKTSHPDSCFSLFPPIVYANAWILSQISQDCFLWSIF
jgi:hypothetical protein